MFSVIFEVHPKPEQWDAYLGLGKMLKPELEKIDGFVDNIRYRSLRHDGWLLSLSGWRDEKALVRWRTQARHHVVQEKGRSDIFLDYHLRIGQLTQDTRPPEGHALSEQRLDETETGDATTITLDRRQASAGMGQGDETGRCREMARLSRRCAGPGRVGCVRRRADAGRYYPAGFRRDLAAAEAFEAAVSLQDGARLRRVRVVRDYGMFDRREAPHSIPTPRARRPSTRDSLPLPCKER